ncbi:GAF domain-containing protein [Magnetococcales bacterium HHB-1]
MPNLDPYFNALKQIKAMDGAAASSEERQHLMRLFIQVLPDIFEVEHCHIYLFDVVNQRIWLHLATLLDEIELDLPARDTLAGEAILTGRCVIINDLPARGQFYEFFDSRLEPIVQSVITAPIRHTNGESSVGALQLINRHHGVFSREDCRLLEQLSQHLRRAATALTARQEEYDRRTNAHKPNFFERLLMRFF